MYPADIHRRYPGVAREADLGNELVGPTRDDGLSGRVAAGMIVISSLGVRLRIAAGPRSDVHRVDGRTILVVASHRVAGQEIPHGVLVDPSLAQGGVEAAPA